MRGILRRVVGYFVSGVFVLLPAVVTVAIVGAIVRWLVGVLGPHSAVGQLLAPPSETRGGHWVVLAVVYSLVIVLLIILGYATKARARSWLIAPIQVAFRRFPIVNRLYVAVEQVVNVLRQQPAAQLTGGALRFGEVVIVRFSNLRAIGILTSRKVYRFGGESYMQVLLPSCPMPLTGFLWMAPVDDIHSCDLNIEDLAKMVVSFGSLTTQIFEHEVRIRRFSMPEETETRSSEGEVVSLPAPPPED